MVDLWSGGPGVLQLRTPACELELCVYRRSENVLSVGPLLPLVPWLDDARAFPHLAVQVTATRARDPVRLRPADVRVRVPSRPAALGPSHVTRGGRYPIGADLDEEVVTLRAGEAVYLHFAVPPASFDSFVLDLALEEPPTDSVRFAFRAERSLVLYLLHGPLDP